MKMVVTVVENLKVQPFWTVTDVTKCYRLSETLKYFFLPLSSRLVFESESQRLCSVCTQKSPTYIQWTLKESNMHSRKLNRSALETTLYALETALRTLKRAPYVHSKEPCMYSKEPYIDSMDT